MSLLSPALRRLLGFLDTTDVVNCVFFAILSLGMIIGAAKIQFWWLFILANVAVIVAIVFLADLASTRTHIWRLFHGFYMMICIPIAFKEVYYLVPALHPVDYDQALAAIDFWLFGINPTVWIGRFAHPALTEILQIAYASFYLLPMILTIDLYRKKRMQAFRIVFLTVILGFYISYWGYLAVPAVGPRFTLHEFHKVDDELPGLYFTKILRYYTDFGESIPQGTVDTLKHVQRDVFPSGHTEITLLVMFLAFRYRARSRYVIGILGTLLVVATVYLRYHYVIDLLGGVLFAILSFEAMKLIDSGWYRVKNSLAKNGLRYVRTPSA